MDIDALIALLKSYKKLGARRVLLSLDDNKPPQQFHTTFAPIGDVVYVRSATELFDIAPEIIYNAQLRTLQPDGRVCEVCGTPMVLHKWVALDVNGFVLNCSVQQFQYEHELISTGQIRRRALEAQDLEAYNEDSSRPRT